MFPSSSCRRETTKNGGLKVSRGGEVRAASENSEPPTCKKKGGAWTADLLMWDGLLFVVLDPADTIGIEVPRLGQYPTPQLNRPPPARLLHVAYCSVPGGRWVPIVWTDTDGILLESSVIRQVRRGRRGATRCCVGLCCVCVCMCVMLSIRRRRRKRRRLTLTMIIKHSVSD